MRPPAPSPKTRTRWKRPSARADRHGERVAPPHRVHQHHRAKQQVDGDRHVVARERQARRHHEKLRVVHIEHARCDSRKRRRARARDRNRIALAVLLEEQHECRDHQRDRDQYAKQSHRDPSITRSLSHIDLWYTCGGVSFAYLCAWVTVFRQAVARLPGHAPACALRGARRGAGPGATMVQRRACGAAGCDAAAGEAARKGFIFLRTPFGRFFRGRS